jgi:glycosyltransferase involved in cell wall biosynthesis
MGKPLAESSLLAKALVIIPALNEEKILPVLLDRLKGRYPGLNILVVDDGSTDRTRKLAKASQVCVVSHPFNLGYGAAMQTGYKYALSRDYRFVVQIDADGQHEVDDLWRLLEPVMAGECDLTVGSRFLGDGSYQPTWARALGIQLFAAIASRLLGQTITDPTSGFQAMNDKVLQVFAGKYYPDDYPDADTLVMLHYFGLGIKEIPVRMYPKAGSSMHRGIWRPLFYIAKMFLSLMVTYSLKGHFNSRCQNIDPRHPPSQKET